MCLSNDMYDSNSNVTILSHYINIHCVFSWRSIRAVWLLGDVPDLVTTSFFGFLSFYRTMYKARYCDRILSVHLSVCLSVMFRYRNHIGWNSSKIISLPNSLRPLLWLTPTWAIWCTFIRSIATTVINNFGKSSRGHSQGLPKFFRASIYRRISRSSLR